MKEMMMEERPREKALKFGIENISNRELLAIQLKNGYKNVSVLELADEVLLKSNGIAGLWEMELEDLLAIKGIQKVKAIELLANFELNKRISYSKLKEKKIFQSSTSIANYFNQKIGFKKQEHFVVMYLDNKHQMIHEEVLFIGTINSSVVHNREIFKHAMRYSAAKIIVVHNHPSGDCIPSENDILVTHNIEQAGILVGIPLLDHIIVGKNNYYSFRENQILI